MRTPNGEGVGALRSDGSGEAWNFDWARTGRLVRTGRWPASAGAERVDHFVVLDAGLCCVMYFAKFCARFTFASHRSPFCHLLILEQPIDPAYLSARDAPRALYIFPLRSLSAYPFEPSTHAHRRHRVLHHCHRLRYHIWAHTFPLPPVRVVTTPPRTSKDDPPRRPNGLGRSIWHRHSRRRTSTRRAPERVRRWRASILGAGGRAWRSS